MLGLRQLSADYQNHCESHWSSTSWMTRGFLKRSRANHSLSWGYWALRRHGRLLQNMCKAVRKRRTREEGDNVDRWQHEDDLGSSIFFHRPGSRGALPAVGPIRKYSTLSPCSLDPSGSSVRDDSGRSRLMSAQRGNFHLPGDLRTGGRTPHFFEIGEKVRKTASSASS